jgi:hypothetical protein
MIATIQIIPPNYAFHPHQNLNSFDFFVNNGLWDQRIALRTNEGYNLLWGIDKTIEYEDIIKFWDGFVNYLDDLDRMKSG